MNNIGILLAITLLCSEALLINAHRNCMKRIYWKDLLKDLEKLKAKFSLECVKEYDERNLCDPKALVRMTDQNSESLIDIVKKTYSIYEKDYKEHAEFLNAVLNAKMELETCHPNYATNKKISECFEKTEAFLINKNFSFCSWAIVNDLTREMLQRLERLSVRRR